MANGAGKMKLTKKNNLKLNIALIAISIGLFNFCPLQSDAKPSNTSLSDWPKIESAIKKNDAQEQKIKEILSQMTLRQKIGQMTQTEIKKITPQQVKENYIGSVLNGGGSWPQMNKHAKLDDWVKLSDAYYDASMASDMKTQIPIIWGIDAVHGNNNIFGATIFPHNIGLGAANDVNLIKKIAIATAHAVRATGINWAFAPTLAIVQNQRWGRAYEGFGADPNLVKKYGEAYVSALQGNLTQDGNVIASAKHFLGDGGTKDGVNEGKNFSSENELINIHAQGYYGALKAGAQTVMATYNSWDNEEAGFEAGKIHGNKKLLTVSLKDKMGFDGFVISDWNGIGQVKNCTNSHCPQSINAGVDMVMVPDDWKEFIENTIKDVEEGRIPMSRIDDAVTRILRVKMRAGLWNAKPSQSKFAGQESAIDAKDLAREAVRKSIVLLKNNNNILPLAINKKILVVGDSANKIANQAGGWSITWQGDETSNEDYPNATSLLKALQNEVGEKNIVYSRDGKDVNLKNFGAIIAIIGETPYAETKGDVRLPALLDFTTRFNDEAKILNNVSGKGVPLVTIFYSGRTLYANDLINKSDAFVAAFLPGTEAQGISDVILRGKNGKAKYDFSAKLSFPWPSNACPPAINEKKGAYRPLFSIGYGLNYRQTAKIGQLKLDNSKTCQ